MATAINGKMWQHSFIVPLDKIKDIKEEFDSLLETSAFSILNFCEYKFEPHGYTALWLLGESHLAVHTFPEINEANFQLVSCNLDKYLKFITRLNDLYEC